MKNSVITSRHATTRQMATTRSVKIPHSFITSAKTEKDLLASLTLTTAQKHLLATTLTLKTSYGTAA